MLFKNNKKFESVFINGKSWKKGYLNGNLIFSKGTVDRYFMDLWWRDTRGNIHKEEIRTIDDFNILCKSFSTDTYTYTLSNGNSFTNLDILDFSFRNAVDFPTTFTANFGFKWTSLEMGIYSGELSITIPDICRTIGARFLEGSSFNGNINLNNIIRINANFLTGSTFNKPLDLRKITYIGNNFLRDDLAFNQPLEVYAESVGIGFLAHTSSTETNNFNSNLTLYNTTTIGDGFLSGQPSEHNIFNANLSLPNTITTIGQNFLRSCNYAKTLDFSGMINLNSIGNDFNTDGNISGIILPTVAPLSIGNDFMFGHTGSISSTFIIPSNVTYIGDGFLNCSENYYTYNKIECNADPSSWASDGEYKSMCYVKRNADYDMQYITLTGTYANELKAKYPASNTSVSYSEARYYA